MTRQKLYELMVEWVQRVSGPTVPVYRTHQGTSIPTKARCIFVDDNMLWVPTGLPTLGVSNGTTRDLLHTYRIELNVIEFNGDGEVLRTLQEDLQTNFTIQWCKTNLFSVLSFGRILKVFREVDDAMWRDYYYATLVILVTSKSTETMTTIDQVVVEPNWRST